MLMLYTPLLKLFFLRLQDPEGEPLMLDRFDARWMLDMGDFSKGPMPIRSGRLQSEAPRLSRRHLTRREIFEPGK